MVRWSIGLSALLLTAACSGSSVPADRTAPPPSSPSAASSSSLSPDASPSPPGLRVREVRRIEVPGFSPEQADLFGDYVVWGGRTEHYGDAKAIWLHDLRSRESRVIARATQAGHFMSWARGSGERVVYVDTSERAWSIYVLSLVDGSRRLVARSSRADNVGFVPAPVIERDWIVWDEALTGGADADPENPTSRLWALNTATGKRRLLTTEQLYMPVLDAGRVSFVGIHGTRQDAYAVDLNAQPPAGPRALTRSGNVGGLAAGGGYTVYYEPVAGDATSVNRVRTAGGKPELVSSPGGGDLAVGDGFVLWFDTGGVVVKRLDDASDYVTLLPERRSVITRVSADGRRAVFGEDVTTESNPDGLTALTGRVVLHVVEIAPG